jgi:hypothetical protein
VEKCFDVERARPPGAFPAICALEAVVGVELGTWGGAAGGNVADDEEAEADMARKREWAEWLEK